MAYRSQWFISFVIVCFMVAAYVIFEPLIDPTTTTRPAPPKLPSYDENDIGHFLHITDIHLDENYLTGSTIESTCHTKDPAAKGGAGKYGETYCDTPLLLANKTFEWIKHTWQDQLDFVVWTGDNARHDGDKAMKRTRESVYRSNQLTADMMLQTFPNTPVVPCLGNNDVVPHNTINDPQLHKKTRKLLQFYQALWQPWIPTSQMGVFAQHGGHVTHVSHQLRVLSLNTMYFIKKNKKVEGCDRDGAAQLHMAWFEQEIDRARQEGAKVLVIGHVPPNSDYRYSCLDAYTRVSANYADVITGHLFGHLNKDHFLLYDTSRSHVRSVDDDDQDHRPFLPPPAGQQVLDGQLDGLQKIPKFARSLRDMYESLNPRNLDRLRAASKKSPVVAIQVGPSILPKYHPTVRIYSYSKTDGVLLGYQQFYADLNHWDSPESSQDYTLEYSTALDYDMPDLSAESFYDLAKRMVDPDDATGNKHWKTYVNNIFVQTRAIFA
ncbi:hypothetical protein DM01DRAFT_1382909 [Hesseltinella vesiculosa]|uniref:Uncharacterized protein n=1 Tax=Hesseltinella vesiculosa TaxID=101127 RepID=A0A1X2GIW4_9FUNG|nr:hypothetical protein DM01DRAFT_1382909 [Hesseltinella vesiculosa]